MKERGCVRFDNASGGLSVTGRDANGKGAPGAGDYPGNGPSLVDAKLCLDSRYLMITTSTAAGSPTGRPSRDIFLSRVDD
jgi:hypothetical protein